MRFVLEHFAVPVAAPVVVTEKFKRRVGKRRNVQSLELIDTVLHAQPESLS